MSKGTNGVTYPKITTGTYVGNITVNRAIAHGQDKIPARVMITDIDDKDSMIICRGVAYIQFIANGKYSVTAMDATYFYIGNATSYYGSANANDNYNWMAFSE